MGGGASTAIKTNEVTHSKDKREIFIPVDNLTSHIRVFQHGSSGEVMVMIDQSIESFISDSSDWFAVKLCPNQAAYFDTLKLSLIAKNNAAQLSSSPTLNTDNNHQDKKSDSDKLQLVDLNESHKLDFKADDKRGNQLNSSPQSKPLIGKTRLFEPTPYLPPRLYHNDLTNDARMANMSQSFAHSQSFAISSGLHSGKDAMSPQVVGKGAKAVESPRGNRSPRPFFHVPVRCDICGEAYSSANIDVVEEHHATCAMNSELRKCLEEVNRTLDPALSELSRTNHRQLEDILYRALTSAADELDNNNAGNNAVQMLVRRVLNVSHTSTFDGRLIEKLFADLDSQMSLVAQAIKNTTDDRSRNELSAFKIILRDSENQLKEKVAILTKFSRSQLNVRDFEFIRAIGKGGFGSVYLAQRTVTTDTKKLCAIKVMSKSAIRKTNSELQILRERKALALAGKYPDYFVRLQCSFQRGDNLFLVMEYMAGGDCMTLLNSMPDGRLPEMVTQHIIAQVVTAVKHLHHHGVVHRDIKPDNVMITNRGHAKLGDFGLVVPFSRQLQPPSPSLSESGQYSPAPHSHVERQYSANLAPMWLENDQDIVNNSASGMKGNWSQESSSSIFFTKPAEHLRLTSQVGNYNYACPEMVEDTAYDHTVDWWAVGVMLFHFLAGVTPFDGPNKDVTKDNISRYQKDGVNWSFLPRNISENTLKFIKDIITKRNDLRLGYVSSEQVIRHVYFSNLDWSSLYTDVGPYYPLIEGPTGKEFLCFTTLTQEEANEVPDFENDEDKGGDDEFVHFTYFS